MDFTQRLNDTFHQIDESGDTFPQEFRKNIIDILTEKVGVEAKNIADAKVKSIHRDLEESYKASSKAQIKKQVAKHVKNKSQEIETKLSEAYTLKVTEISERFTRKFAALQDRADESIIAEVAVHVDAFMESAAAKIDPVSIIKNSKYVCQLESTLKQMKKLMCINEITLDESVKSLVDDASVKIEAIKESSSKRIQEATKKADEATLRCESYEKQATIMIAEMAEMDSQLKDLSSSTADAKSVLAENAVLKKDLNERDARTLLENKVKDLSPMKRTYIKRMFAESSVREINEGFIEAVKAYNDEESNSRRDRIIESVQSNAVKYNSDILTESVTQTGRSEMGKLADLVNASQRNN